MHKFLKEPKTRQNPHALVGALILLGRVTEPKALDATRRVLCEALAPKQPEAVRRNAAVSLARLPVPAKGADALLVPLMPFLCEKDWSPVPQNLLPLLQKLELSPPVAIKLLPLLRKCPHEAVRLHALERLRGLDRPDVVREVMPFLSAEHPRLRVAAETTLKTLPGAIDTLFALLVDAPRAETAQRIQWVLRFTIYPGFAAAGAQVLLFQFGGAGIPEKTLLEPSPAVSAPPIWATANQETYKRCNTSIDYYSGTVILGEETIEEAGNRLVNLVREIASGSVTWSETLSYVEESAFYTMTPPF